MNSAVKKWAIPTPSKYVPITYGRLCFRSVSTYEAVTSDKNL